MDYAQLMQQAERLAAQGDAASVQAAHDLLLQHSLTGLSEAENDRLWARIFDLREQAMELAGLPPNALSDVDLAGFKVVSIEP